MNINKANSEIKNIKYPYFFLFNLITYFTELDDYNLSLILRLFLKNHMEVALNTNLLNILFNELESKKNSLKVLERFYILIGKKLNILLLLKKFYLIYKNIEFWKLSIDDEIDYILNIKLKFLAIYDCSKGGIPFHHKLNCLFIINNPSKNEILDNIKERLLLILEIFNVKIFEALDIPLIKISEFYTLDPKIIIKYLSLIFKKFNKLLEEMQNLLENYNIITNEFINLLNPVVFDIEDNINDTIFN
jgi:hypothetical protein